MVEADVETAKAASDTTDGGWNRTGHVMQTGGPWMILMTNKNEERHVMSQLRADEYEAYLPMTSREAWVKGVPCAVIRSEPIYPGYLFLRRLVTMKRAVTALRGAKDLLTYGVTDAFIEAHKAKEVEGLIALIEKKKTDDAPKEKFKPGDRVRTLDELMELIVLEVTGKNRASCLATFLGSCRTVVVDLRKVVRTGETEG